jgi:hypothetical protein
MKSLTLKQFFLYLLIASVAISALLGIGVMIFGSGREFETKILLTTFCVTITSILGLACGAYLEAKRDKIIPISGIIFAISSAVLWIVLIWVGIIREELFVKALMSSTLIAAACSHISLLSLAKLEKRFLWSYYTVHISIWALTAILLFTIWAEYDPSTDWLARTLGVLSIIIGALTIVTPVFHWLSRGEFAGKDSTIKEIELKITKLKEELSRLEQQHEELLKRED